MTRICEQLLEAGFLFFGRPEPLHFGDFHAAKLLAPGVKKDKPPVSEDIFIHRAYTRAIENSVFILSCNRVGVHGHCHFLGQSIIVAPNGKVLARASSDREEVIRAEIELSKVTEYRTYTGIYTVRRPDLYSHYGV